MFLMPQNSVSAHSAVLVYVVVPRFFFNTVCATGGVKTVTLKRDTSDAVLLTSRDMVLAKHRWRLQVAA